MNSQPEIDVAGVQPAQEEQKDLSFAEMLKQLEAIVDRLESGELSLEESLAKFEEGVRLARQLESILARAESRVQEILKAEAEHLETEEADDFSDACKEA